VTFQEFEGLARSYNVIPLQRTILGDVHTPVSTYLTLREGSVRSFLFESAEPDEKVGRYSFVGINPLFTVRARGDSVAIENGNGAGWERADIFETLRALAGKYRQAPLSADTLPHDGEMGSAAHGFSGGFVGYLGYNCVRSIEALDIASPGPDEEDDAVFGFFPSVVMFDHRHHLISLLHNVIVDPGSPLREQYERGRQVLEALELRLRKSAVPAQTFRCEIPEMRQADRAWFCGAVRRAQEHIVEGDIFQVVLSRRIRMGYSGDLFGVYRALRVVNPSPYLFHLELGETKLVGSSPEVLVRLQGDEVEVLPIAGTRRRGGSHDEDLALERELLQDEKELAEHLMLVDLGRNDVGRISRYGSVDVPVFKRVERYSHVMHLVSEVHGRLRPGAGPVDVLKACFPAGTVSGAPKVRAMEIINELEPCRRGVYAGAVGYLGLNGNLDTCIAIRTIVAHHDTLHIQAGAGIVADSDPEREYAETEHKARALLEAVAMASRGLSLDDRRARAGQKVL